MGYFKPTHQILIDGLIVYPGSNCVYKLLQLFIPLHSIHSVCTCFVPFLHSALVVTLANWSLYWRQNLYSVRTHRRRKCRQKTPVDVAIKCCWPIEDFLRKWASAEWWGSHVEDKDKLSAACTMIAFASPSPDGVIWCS